MCKLFKNGSASCGGEDPVFVDFEVETARLDEGGEIVQKNWRSTNGIHAHTSSTHANMLVIEPSPLSP